MVAPEVLRFKSAGPIWRRMILLYENKFHRFAPQWQARRIERGSPGPHVGEILADRIRNAADSSHAEADQIDIGLEVMPATFASDAAQLRRSTGVDPGQRPRIEPDIAVSRLGECSRDGLQREEARTLIGRGRQDAGEAARTGIEQCIRDTPSIH